MRTRSRRGGGVGVLKREAGETGVLIIQQG